MSKDIIEAAIESIQKDFEDKMSKRKIDPVKYEYGDWVKFKIKMFESTAENEYVGQIAIIDRYGTFEQNEEPSYDIYVPEMNCLFKHFRQSAVTLDHKGDGTCLLDSPMHKN